MSEKEMSSSPAPFYYLFIGIGISLTASALTALGVNLQALALQYSPTSISPSRPSSSASSHGKGIYDTLDNTNSPEDESPPLANTTSLDTHHANPNIIHRSDSTPTTTPPESPVFPSRMKRNSNNSIVERIGFTRNVSNSRLDKLHLDLNHVNNSNSNSNSNSNNIGGSGGVGMVSGIMSSPCLTHPDGLGILPDLSSSPASEIRGSEEGLLSGYSTHTIHRNENSRHSSNYGSMYFDSTQFKNSPSSLYNYDSPQQYHHHYHHRQSDLDGIPIGSGILGAPSLYDGEIGHGQGCLAVKSAKSSKIWWYIGKS